MQLMRRLREDHNNIRKLLVILQNKLAVGSGSPPNFSLLRDVIDYFTDYIDHYHHPREELIYRYLERHYPAASAPLKPFREHHDSLQKLIAPLRREVALALLDAPVSLDRFQRKLSGFIAKEREHLEWEEAHAYPCFDQTLSQADWSALEQQPAARREPQSGSGRPERFGELYEALIEDLG